MRVSNRVFWAGVFLAGCVIVSGRSISKPTPEVQDVIRARGLEIVDSSGRSRITLEANRGKGAFLSIRGADVARSQTVFLGTSEIGEYLECRSKSGGDPSSETTVEVGNVGKLPGLGVSRTGTGGGIVILNPYEFSRAPGKTTELH